MSLADFQDSAGWGEFIILLSLTFHICQMALMEIRSLWAADMVTFILTMKWVWCIGFAVFVDGIDFISGSSAGFLAPTSFYTHLKTQDWLFNFL